MSISSKRQWNKRSTYWDTPNRKIKYQIKLANRKFRKQSKRGLEGTIVIKTAGYYY